MEDERERLDLKVQIQILKNEVGHLREDVDDHDQTLYNDGKGIVYDVRQLKWDKHSTQTRFASVINVISVVISLICMLLLLFEKMK